MRHLRTQQQHTHHSTDAPSSCCPMLQQHQNHEGLHNACVAATQVHTHTGVAKLAAVPSAKQTSTSTHKLGVVGQPKQGKEAQRAHTAPPRATASHLEAGLKPPQHTQREISNVVPTASGCTRVQLWDPMEHTEFQYFVPLCSVKSTSEWTHQTMHYPVRNAQFFPPRRGFEPRRLSTN